MPRQKVPPPDVTNRKNLLHKEPSVINEQMIQSSLDTLLPPGDEGKYARLDGINSREAKHLLLEFQNVSQVANLSHMQSLTKLQLCNNILTKIEKLDTLVNLVWLDLSFNSIRKIENLENLRKLECINLHRNLITKLENLDNQLRLEIFIVSSNGINSLDHVKYLRRFIRLRSVNFEGNPITGDANYRAHTVALLPQISLLDYVRVTAAERSRAEAKYKDQLVKIAAVDDKLRRRASVVEADEAVQDTYKAAFVHGFYEDEFWTDLCAQDNDGKIVLMIGDTDDIQNMYHELFRRASRELFVKGMANYSMRQNEINAYNTSIKEEKDVITAAGRKITEAFVLGTKDKIRTMRGWVNMIEDLERRVGTSDLEKYPKEQRAKYDEYRRRLNNCVLEYISDLHNIWFAIMSTEMGLHEQIMEVNQELDRSLQELVSTWLEQLRGFFGVLRDIQIQYHERLVEDLVTYGNFRLSDTNIPQNLHHLLQDKEALQAVIQAAHENHNAFIDSKEEAMVSSLKKWLENTVTSLSRDENHRNRMRVSEISHFVDYQRRILDEKHIIPYVTCYLPEIRSDQVQPPQVEEEATAEGDKAPIRLSQMRISDTLLNLTKIQSGGLGKKGSSSKHASSTAKVE